MTRVEKINLRIINILFYMKNLKKKKHELCKNCGKPIGMHNRRWNSKKYLYCFPYGPDIEKYKL